MINLLVVISTTSNKYSKKLLNLATIYIDDTQYNGCNNSFTFKLAIFYNICLRTKILTEAKIKAFPILLKDLVLDYYYSNISISVITINFNQVYNSIRNYFEGAKYKQIFLLK